MGIQDSSHLLRAEVCALTVPTNIKVLLSGSAVEWARIKFKET